MTDQSPLYCLDNQRRQAVRASKDLNGLDYLEVSDDQLTLTVYFLKKAPTDLSIANVRIDGGIRIRDIQVIDLIFCREEDPDIDDCMKVTVDKPGDSSTYTLCIVEAEQGRPGHTPHHEFDPRYACLEFNFNVNCPSDLDCAQAQMCVPEPQTEPDINYLAKDYASFRQLVLDRLALIMPEWQETHVPDIGNALVELLAYTGDYLSYYQDAVGTEAYLDTARLRVSVRRHARLVDYTIHEGCNSRTWICLEVEGQSKIELDPQDFYLITRYPSDKRDGRPLSQDDLRKIPAGDYLVFEPLSLGQKPPLAFYPAHNRIKFYTWGNRECCLPRGATRATLIAGQPPTTPDAPAPQEQYAGGHDQGQSEKYPGPNGPIVFDLRLRPGDYLIFEEVIGPKTGNPADADPTHRHVVRLTRADPGIDPLNQQPILEIEWEQSDALPFPLCISTIGPAPECKLIEDISVACGNVILVDHGGRIEDEPLGQVPIVSSEIRCGDDCNPPEIIRTPGKFRPRLQKTPLTFSQPIEPGSPASLVLVQDPRQALPWIRLISTPAVIDPFRCGESIRFAPLAARWREARDPLSQYLKGQLSQEARALLDAYDGADPPSPELQKALVQGLNEQLDNRTLYDPGRFAGVRLDRETRRLLDYRPQNSQLNRLLNRWLLEDAFAAEMARSQRHFQIWIPQRDLFASQGADAHFVVEMEEDGVAYLRFGDGELGRRPEVDTQFWATYRIGNGLGGSVGSESFSAIVLRHGTLSGVTIRPCNPFPVQGCYPSEPLDEIKLFAPQAFRKDLQRAVTAEDYAQIVKRKFSGSVQGATASLRWTGTGYQAWVAIDPFQRTEAAKSLLEQIERYLYRYRRIGHEVKVGLAIYVPLEIGLTVCVKPAYLRGHVKSALLEAFSNRSLPNGQRGFFHPDNLSFGEGIYLSKLVAAAMNVPGVENVQVTLLKRLGESENGEIASGFLPLGPLEVARLDNDPGFPENGLLRLEMKGGR